MTKNCRLGRAGRTASTGPPSASQRHGSKLGALFGLRNHAQAGTGVF